jgi:hypothetical protein
MLKKFLVMFSLCCVVLGGSTFLNVVSARTTLDKYNSSGIFVITTKGDVELLAEANAASLSLGTLPKGTKLVPINQVRNVQETVLYNLVIRADGAVGFVPADATIISHN